MIDQWYLEDLSDNIRATLASKRKQGLWVGAFAPYGYIKDPKNKNHLIIDDEAAEVVRYVFSLYLKGYGITTIARRLNEEHIPNPATYKQQHGQPFQNAHRTCSDMWHTYSIQRMISNELYIGNTVQGIQENISYKSNKKRYKPKEEWDIVEGTHDAIIDIDTWEKVQHLREQKPKSYNAGEPNIFAKKVRCLKCGSSMRICYCNHQRYFRCNTAYFAPQRCSGMYISESVLQREVIKQINSVFDNLFNEQYVFNKANINGGLEQKLKMLQKTLDANQRALAKDELRQKNLYLDKLDGLISNEDYLRYKNVFEMEIQDLQRAIAENQNSIENLYEQLNHTSRRSVLLNKFKNISALSFPIVQSLINYIEVGGSKNERTINIHWNF